MAEFAFDPISVVILLVSLSLAPFLVLLISSFVKIIVVLSLVRNALGVQQIPPNMVLNGLAIILSIYVMYPVVMEINDIIKTQGIKLDTKEDIFNAINVVKEPVKKFLKKHTMEKSKLFFVRTAKKIWPAEQAAQLKEDDLLVLVPAFTVTELTSAFQIGFLLYLPFIAIDLIVSNILLALGMMMVSPMTISLPFKLMLFVLVDGWSKLINGLVLTYR